MIVEFVEKYRVAKIFEKRFETSQHRRKSKHEIVSSITLNDDNWISLLLIENKYINDKLKHIVINYYFIRDLFERKLISMNFVSSDVQMFQKHVKYEKQ